MTNSEKTKYIAIGGEKVLYIYMFENKINGKKYIGQTNNIEKRKRGHKSDMNNQKSRAYNDAFHSALRKYGWDNFNFSILEEIDDDFGREYLNQREIDYIQIFKTRVNENGYNISAGGDGCTKGKLTFEERCKCSKIFSENEIRDIQNMLINQHCTFEIMQKYPKLSQSMVNNINIGYNFKRDDLAYPLSKSLSEKFSLETRQKIINDIKNGLPYSQIAKQYFISISQISNINNGRQWYDKNAYYPLCKKGCADGAYVKDLKYDLIFTTVSMKDLAKKYNKSYSCIKSINSGQNRFDNRLIYPLRLNNNKNQVIWSTLF